MTQHATILRLIDAYNTQIVVTVISFHKLTELDITEMIRENYPDTEAHETVIATKNVIHV